MKFRSLALAVVMALSLTACGTAASTPSETPVTVTSNRFTQAPTPEAAATPAPTPEPLNEPPILDSVKDQPVPEFLDAEQQDLFLRAYSAAIFLWCYSYGLEDFPLKEGHVWEDPDEVVVIDDMPYVMAQGRYARWDDFKAMMDGLFTAEYQEDVMTLVPLEGKSRPRFISTGNGRLCFLDTQMGGDIEYAWCHTPDSYELVSQTEDEIVFDFIGHYAHQGYDPEADRPTLLDEYTETYPIRMVKTDGGWRFDEFRIHF